MAHELEIKTDGTASMAYSMDGGVPWHGLGTPVKGLMSSAEALDAAGLDWQVNKVGLYVKSPSGEGFSKITDKFAVQRATDGRVLGAVGGDYVPFQNSDAFAFMDTMIGTDEARFDTAMSLFGGKRVVMTAQLEGFTVLGDDAYDRWLMVSNSHDGSRAFTAAVVNIRVVCANTEAMALRGAKQTWSITHRGDLAGKVQEAKETLGLADKYTEAFKVMVEELAKIEVADSTFEAILKANFAEQKRQLPANLEAVRKIRETSPRISDDLRSTGYGALSALTEWTSHGKAYRTEEARMKNLLLGWGKTTVSSVARELLAV